jgi:hypothetical protein
MNITPYLNEINNLNPLEQRLNYYPEHWVNYNYNNPRVNTEIIQITNQFNHSLSRNEIINYLRLPNRSLLRGFIMTMMWGHGFEIGRHPDNRGPWKLSRMLNDLDTSEAIINNAQTHLINNDIIAACLEFNGIDRCGVSFFSKYFYFLGRALDMNVYPIIFDSRVANSIIRLNSIDPILIELIDINPKQNPESYQNFINFIHTISIDNDVEGENLEYFLFLGV